MTHHMVRNYYIFLYGGAVLWIVIALSLGRFFWRRYKQRQT